MIGVVAALAALCGAADAVQGINSRIYTSLGGFPCVRLLDDDGVIGCNTGRTGVVQPLFLLDDQLNLDAFLARPPSKDYVVLLNSTLFSRSNVEQLRQTGHVRGLLVMDGPPNPNGFSAASPYPNQRTSLHPESDHVWNAAGSNMNAIRYDFPMSDLSREETELLKERARENAEGGYQYPMWSVELKSFMHAVRDSKTCLRRGHCIPMGGRSFWSTFRPDVSALNDVVMATATLDSAALFHDSAVGANAYTSGVVALVAAIDALSTYHNSNDEALFDLPRDLVFAFFNNEAFGHGGSRRFVEDLRNFECEERFEESDVCMRPRRPDPAFEDLDFDRIKYMFDISQVGMPANPGRMFVHYEFDPEEQPATREVVDTVIAAAEGGAGVTLAEVTATVPGLPPSPLESFLRVDATIGAAAMADHGPRFTNQYFHSMFDTIDNVQLDALCAASTTAARSLYALAAANSTAVPDALAANCTLVTELASCLMDDLGCDLVTLFNNGNRDSGTPTSYTSVHRFTLVTQQVGFLYDFVKRSTASLRVDVDCESRSDCEEDTDQVCILGECVLSSTHYHYSFSAALEYSGGWSIVAEDGSTDVPWTESNWDNEIGIRLFKRDNPVHEILFFLCGAFVLCISLGTAFLATRFLETHAKRQ